jgi:hypothetical protein
MVALATAGGLSFAGVGISNAAGDVAAPTASANDAVSADVQQVLSEYVRDTDHRDGASVSKLFTPQGTVDISAKDANGDYQLVGSPIVGRAAIANAVTNLQSPVGGLTSEHHVTSDPLLETHGNSAHLNVEFFTWAVQGATEPAGGWPAGTAGAQATIGPYEVGYYDITLLRSGAGWQISDLHILHDLPFVVP